MPPVRKNSKTIDEIADSKIKPMKTVRTHEENQERAYVAASRRSDRSLEARIESARRASEIHKKRTGRAFRITEEDVLNEQYYEEVDDDIPASIRRLQMHLNGLYHWNNPRFDSYMISNYAKHHAAWIAQRFGQQGNSQYANPPIFSNSFGQVPPGMPGNSGPAASGGPTSPSLPQQMPGQQAQGGHQRSASIAESPSASYPPSSYPFASPNGETAEEQRRFSMPAQSKQANDGSETRPSLSRTGSASDEGAESQYTASPPQQPLNGFPTQSVNNTCQPQQMMGGQNFDNSMSPNSFGPFSPTMAFNVQQLWDGSSNMATMPYFGNDMGYLYNPNSGSSKSQNQNQAFNQGIHQTLTANPLGLGGMDQAGMPNQGSKAITPGAGTGQNFDNFWSGDASQAGSHMGTDFEGFFNFPSSNEHGSGDNYLDDFTNVNDDVAVTEQ